MARHDIAIYCVDGDTKFPVPVLLLQEFEVPWAIVCDGKVFSDSDPPGILKYPASAKVPNVPDTGGPDVAQTCERLRQAGVFTLAKDRDEFEALPVIRDNAVAAGRAVGLSKARRARYIAENYPPPREWPNC